MIISERVDKDRIDFERLLGFSYEGINREASKNSQYFINRSATEIENDIFDFLCEAAKGTDFDKTIQLISGHKFPDIVVKKFYGVEVKTTKQNHWKSTGNSVLESTRIENVGRVYIFFAKLNEPVSFKYRLYQECLYDIAVTHSPRYLIDMDLAEGKTIFDKIGLSYDTLRLQDNPIKPIVEYYRSIAQPGEEPWWMDSGKSPEFVTRPTVIPWSNLSQEEQSFIRIQAMARFPELFGKASSKYKKLAAWLAARHGVVDSSLRDRFSAGGKIDLEVGGQTYKHLPRIFSHLKSNAKDVIETVKILPSEDAMYHWNLSYLPDGQDKIREWSKSLVRYAKMILNNSDKFIYHLLGASLDFNDCPNEVRSQLAEYGPSYD